MTEPSVPPAAAAPEAILEVDDLRTYFYTDEGVVRAVDGVSFRVYAGETLGIVGESGSGKSVTAASIMRLVSSPGRIVSGVIRFRGTDLGSISEDQVRRLRGAEIAMIFQDPMTSLNPVLRISRQIEEGMLTHRRVTRTEAAKRTIDLLTKMGVTAPARTVKNYPHQFSGGMRQRVMLSMGFANDPALLIADEPTTALDVTIQAQILDLLRQLNDELGVAIILISHDLGVVANLCTRVVVMYAGLIVEEGLTEEILAQPKHPYTWALINAVPRLDQVHQERLVAIEGTPPDLLDPPSGCRFAARCPFRIDKCSEEPPLVEISPGRFTACWVTQAGTPLPAGGATVQVVSRPQAAAAVSVASAPTLIRPSIELDDVDTDASLLVELAHLTKHFPVQTGSFFSKRDTVVHAVDGVDLSIRRGETLGLVGESGSGKSTLGRLIVRLYEPTAGTIKFDGRDISHLNGRSLRPLRRRMQMVFQDPYSSLNPRMSVGEIIAEPLRVHGLTRGEAEARARVRQLLSLVGLDERATERFPYEFSGGQRQRIGIARSLAVEPDFIVADEPVSSLDVNIQAQVINLLRDLQAELGLTYLFIAHDLSVVRHVSNRIAVMYLGKLMEVAPRDELYARPLHPYTKVLISAAPIPDATAERQRRRIPMVGEIPSPIDPPSGCRFRTRCPIAEAVCVELEPPLVEHRPGRWAACHFPGKL